MSQVRMIKSCVRCNGPLKETTPWILAFDKEGMPFLPKARYCPNQKWWEKLLNVYHTVMWKAPRKEWFVQH